MERSQIGRSMRAACIAAGALAAAGTAHAQEARNIILMVTDGMGYNSWEATSYFQHGTLGQQIVDKPSMGHQWTDTSVFTRPLGHNGTLFPQDYNPHAAWQHEGYVTDFGTDSGAAATAMYTGQKTFNGRLSVDRYGDPLKSIADIASERGLATGAVTSVHWSHATPAAVAAKNVNRSDYIPIAQELVYESHLDVLMGAGHPWYDNAGQLKAAPSYNLVGGESTWNDLTSGGTGFSHVETLEAFEQLADWSNDAPDRVLGTAQAGSTLQLFRPGTWRMGDFNQNVPSLATMTRGALNVLDNDEEGFFLMVEGGAVDWAWTVGGAGYRGRAIEEQIDFNRSVEAVVDWVEQFSSWEETLLIVTSDHETGYVVGPNSWQEEVIEFHPIFGTPIVVAEGTTMEPVKNNGQGNLPDLEVLTGNHTSMLVPLWAIGAGSEMFDDPSLRIGYDAYAADFWSADGHYIDNTGIFTVMSESLVIPEPSLLSLMGLGIPLLLRRAVNR